MKSLAIFTLAALMLSGCSPRVQPDPQNIYIIESIQGYPKTLNVYCDDALMSQATKRNSCIIIYVPIQRGRFYVNGRIAADFPVSTGREGSPRLASFRIVHKEALVQHLVSKNVPVYEYDKKRGSYGIVRTGKPGVGGSEQEVVEDNMTYLLKGPRNPCFLQAHPVTKIGVRESSGSVHVPPFVQKKLYEAVQVRTAVYIVNRPPSTDGHDKLLRRNRY